MQKFSFFPAASFDSKSFVSCLLKVPLPGKIWWSFCTLYQNRSGNWWNKIQGNVILLKQRPHAKIQLIQTNFKKWAKKHHRLVMYVALQLLLSTERNMRGMRRARFKTNLGNLLKLWEITASLESHLPHVYSSSSSYNQNFVFRYKAQEKYPNVGASQERIVWEG